MDMAKKNFAEKLGSALILVVVLTSLLSILAVMFMLSSRVDKITASAISGNKELDFGVDSVVAKILQELVDDVNFADHKYYDYPDANNPWLANLEPYQAGGNYYWRHISDLYNLSGAAYNLQASICDEYQTVISAGIVADADGDGVSDSVWVELPDVSSSKGKPVYAAVRVIDNSAMLNVNTAYLFDPNEIDRSRVDGSSQTQINLTALSQRGINGTPAQAAAALQAVRSGSAPPDITAYEQNVVWNSGQQFGAYTPFDISDELKLRNRYLINYNKMTSRIEELWETAYDAYNKTLKVPRDSSTPLSNPYNWFYKANNSSIDPCQYDYHHISTTYNMDRLIAPDGAIMTNANGVTDADLLYLRLRQCIDPYVSDVDFNRYSAQLAQIAANIKDYGDSDANVTIIYDRDRLGNTLNPHYGFEKPCIFISELVYNLVKVDITPAGLPEGTPPQYKSNWSYGIELSKLYPGINGDNWRLRIAGMDYNLPDPNFFYNNDRYAVLVFEDKLAPLAATVSFSDSPENGQTGVDPKVILNWPPLAWNPNATNYDIYFGTDESAVTNATVSEPNGVYIGNQTNNNYKPTSLDPNTTYYWRIDDTDSSRNLVLKGDVWKFTTWVSEPNYIVQYIDQNTIFSGGSLITLERQVKDNNGLSYWLTVDSVIVDPCLTADPCGPYTNVRSYQRDMSEVRWIKHLWGFVEGSATLGYHNDFSNPGAGSMRARPGPFNNVGDLAMVFSKSTYYDTSAGQTPADAIGYTGETEEAVRIDLRDPNFQRIFQYLSAFGHADNGRVKGRININTAPWYVISQLPWVAQKRDNTTLMAFTDYKLAQAIAGYRDKTIVDTNLGYADTTAISNDGRYEGTGLSGLRETPGFESIGELATVVNKFDAPADSRRWYSMRYYIDGVDQAGFPDIDNSRRTLIDNAADDFEERYLIFSRMSDLVTVRSDVFTAYILVRVGNNGPQKRVIAILDRSDVAAGGKVKVIAVHPVPDPR